MLRSTFVGSMAVCLYFPSKRLSTTNCNMKRISSSYSCSSGNCETVIVSDCSCRSAGISDLDHMRPNATCAVSCSRQSLTLLEQGQTATATGKAYTVSSDHDVHSIQRHAQEAFLAPTALTADAVSHPFASYHKSLSGLSVKAFPRS